MTSIALTQPQREILQALTARYNATERPVTRETLATALECTAKRIDYQIKGLKARQLVESRAGPTGGYRPTATAYDVLAHHEIAQPAAVPLTHDGQRVANVTVQAIEFPAVHDPTRGQAVIRLHGAIPDVEPGERLSVGPTPVSQLRVAGPLAETRPATETLILTIDALHAPATNHDAQST